MDEPRPSAEDRRAAPSLKQRLLASVRGDLGKILVVIVAVVLIGAGLRVFGGGGEGLDDRLTASVPPVEFLYLDKARTLTYAEELEGGEVSTEQESRAVKSNLEAKLKLVESVESGGSKEENAELQRSITPTAASVFMELRRALEEGQKIDTIEHPAEFKEFSGLEEGQFVAFRTEELRRPVYLDPYLALRQDSTLSTIFPEPTKGRPGLAKTKHEREASRLFLRQLGASPHMLFSLRPGAQDSVEILLPLNLGSFNKEYGVLKNGGGTLTVLGKVTRVVPEPAEVAAGRPEPLYVDDATRETWRLPIHQAPPLLICRSDPGCRTWSSSRHHHRRPPVEFRARRTRSEMERELERQTEITGDGAVIVPVAIYK